MDEEKDCFSCKFYDWKNLVCMYKCDVRAIFNEQITASKCEIFTKGIFNAQELEDSDYQ